MKARRSRACSNAGSGCTGRGAVARDADRHAGEPGDAWAVGFTIGGIANSQATPVTEHWSGGTWQVVPSPVIDASHPFELASVAAVAPNDAWAVGTVFNNPPAHPVPDLIEHWDGTSWTVQKTLDSAGAQISSLIAISAIAAADAWAVGSYSPNINSATTATLPPLRIMECDSALVLILEVGDALT